VEAKGQASNDAAGYLDFFKGEITESHLGKELLEKVELTEDNTSRLDQFSEEWQDANGKWNAMWGVKIEQTKDGKHYVAGLGLSMEDTEEGKVSQFLVAANRIAFIDPANGNETPMFVAQGNQIFMNEVFLKYLTAPTITSGGNPPTFTLTPDGKLTARNADISGHISANSGALNNVTIEENCTIKGTMRAEKIVGDIVKAVGRAFPGIPGFPNGTLTVQIQDDHDFDRQIIIPPITFAGASGQSATSNDRWTDCGLVVKHNGREIYNAYPAIPTKSFSTVIDMPAGAGNVTMSFTVSSKGNGGGGDTPAFISNLLVMVVKKNSTGISIY
jgi:predicted phage tail protein